MRDGGYQHRIAQAPTSSSPRLIWAALIQITSALTGSETVGSARNPDQAFQFDVDDGQTLVIVVSEVTPDAGLRMAIP